jgi:AraC-like DNA-binding protein
MESNRLSGFEIACLPESPLLLARLRSALGRDGHVRAFDEATAALADIVRQRIDLTVVAIDPMSVEWSLRAIRLLRAALPSHPIVAWCSWRQPASRVLLDIANAGVTELALRDIDDMQHMLSQVLSSARQRSKAGELDARLGPLIADPIRPLFRFALDHAHESLSVDSAAASFGITRRTLRNQLVAHRLPRPRVFLTWCRLLVAGALLDEHGRSLDSIAGQLDFPSGHGLGMVLRRYLGVGITVLRDGQVSATVERAFRAAISEPAPSSLPLESSAD